MPSASEAIASSSLSAMPSASEAIAQFPLSCASLTTINCDRSITKHGSGQI
ncbi:hypothetical protein ACSQ6I_21040 [Anabaena sp. WFMT]|uniref:hypothetical protein n=1 Tax=Anabaena sp. WFMT TaxID=3449730 RepID=UPI003F21D679